MSHYQDLRVGLYQLQCLQNEIAEHFHGLNVSEIDGSGPHRFNADVNLVRATLIKSTAHLKPARLSDALSELLPQEEPFHARIDEQDHCSIYEADSTSEEPVGRYHTYAKLQTCRRRLQNHKNLLMDERESIRVDVEEQRYEELLEAYLNETVDALAKFP